MSYLKELTIAEELNSKSVSPVLKARARLIEALKEQFKAAEAMVAGEGEAPEKIYPLRNNEMLMINVATATSVGVTKNSEKGKATLDLRLPICADTGQRVSLSRRVGSRWRLIGYGTIQ